MDKEYSRFRGIDVTSSVLSSHSALALRTRNFDTAFKRYSHHEISILDDHLKGQRVPLRIGHVPLKKEVHLQLRLQAQYLYIIPLT